MRRALSIAILGGLAFATWLPAQEDTGVQEAIRFQRQKDAADARQARLGDQTSNQAPASDEGVQKAIAFEKAKDVADAQQARKEAQRRQGVNSAANESQK